MIPDKLIDFLFKSMEEGNVVFIIITISVVAIINIKSFSEFIENFRSRKIKNIREALESNIITEKEKKLYEDELKKEYFHNATGLLLNTQHREKVLELYNNYSDELTFRDIKRSVRFMSFVDGNFIFEITLFGYIEQYFNRITSLYLSLAAMTFLAIPIFQKASLSQFVSSYILGIFLLSIAMFLLTQSFNVSSAKLVKKAISKQQKNQQNNQVEK